MARRKRKSQVVELTETSVQVEKEIIEGTIEEKPLEPVEESPPVYISFKTTEKPRFLTEDNLEDFESQKNYRSSIKAGNTVKIFKLTDPITDEPILDKYRIQYEVIAYKGATMTRLYRDRLDANFKVIESENFG